jgi:hypothetical protein
VAEYDWINTSEFESVIRTRIQERLSEAQLQGMPYTFTGRLITLAKENLPVLESRASRGAEPTHTMSDALRSVDIIMTEAISVARAENKTMVTEAELQKAIQARLCRIWPFCR